MTDLDTFDLKILTALQRDATQSMDDLAAAAGLSRNACWRRMRNLEERGVIRKRVALLDGERLNLGVTVFVAVRTSQHSSAWLKKFAAAVVELIN